MLSAVAARPGLRGLPGERRRDESCCAILAELGRDNALRREDVSPDHYIGTSISIWNLYAVTPPSLSILYGAMGKYPPP
jgi:hypothetical protein